MLAHWALGTQEDQSMRTTSAQYWTLASTITALAAPIHAAIIDDASFFDDIPHTFVDFETRADGSPLPLTSGQFAFVPLIEYVPLGFGAFGMDMAWEWSADPDVQQALTEGATPTKLLRMFPFEPHGSLGLGFIPEQHSIGMFITRDQRFAIEPLTITARTFDGSLIDSVTIVGDLVDGVAGNIEYSYVGFNSAFGITAITFSAENFFAIGIDDLRFSQAPGPSAFISIVLFALNQQRRQR
jgi:hypothetical protein